MDIDAVIIELEFELESIYEPYLHYICFRFIDNYPQKTKLESLIKDISLYSKVKIIDYEFTVEKITEVTDITGFEITKH